MRKNIKKVLITVAALAIVGFGVNAFAGWGMGSGHMGGGHRGPGWHHGGGYGPGYQGNLSEADIETMEKERQAFFSATDGLRRELYQKELALRSELAKENPDTQKAIDLQKEISKFNSELDQKHLEHMIAMRKINPNAGRGFSRNGPMGRGSGYGENCWR